MNTSAMKREYNIKSTPKVKDLMTSNVFTLYEDDNVNLLEELMQWKNIRHVPVVNYSNKLVGLVSHRDFLRIAIDNGIPIPSNSPP